MQDKDMLFDFDALDLDAIRALSNASLTGEY